MGIIIERNIDVEETIRAALADYMTCYVKPLPANFTTPSIEITQVGGTEDHTIDTFEVTLDSRAPENGQETALRNLRNAIGILKHIAGTQTTALRFVAVNTLSSWGADPVRPDLAMCTARIRVVAHQEKVEV